MCRYLYWKTTEILRKNITFCFSKTHTQKNSIPNAQKCISDENMPHKSIKSSKNHGSHHKLTRVNCPSSTRDPAGLPRNPSVWRKPTNLGLPRAKHGARANLFWGRMWDSVKLYRYGWKRQTPQNSPSICFMLCLAGTPTRLTAKKNRRFLDSLSLHFYLKLHT